MKTRSRLAAFALSSCIAFALSAAAASAQPPPPLCTKANTVFAHVVALDQPIELNRLGAVQQGGMIFALARDVCLPAGKGTLCDASQPPQPPSAGNVMLKPYKRPRPIVLRVNEQQCLQIGFTNLLSPSANTDYQPTTRTASVHVQGMELTNTTQVETTCKDAKGKTNATCNDGSWVGNNPNGLVSPLPTGKTLTLDSPQITYTLYAAREGAYLLYSTADVYSKVPAVPAHGANNSNGDGGQLEMGLFGAVHVEPRRAEWYRSQVTATDLDAARDRKKGKDGYSPFEQPLPDYKANYGNTTSSQCFQEGTCRIGPILRMICTEDSKAYQCRANEIVHSDLTAVITGPSAGRFSQASSVTSELRSSYALPDRQQPFREFTIIYHEMFNAFQAFQAYYAANGTATSNGEGQDQFGINYGMAGIGSEVLANRLGVGPMANCPSCKFEEFFLTSWAVGDPAMVVDNPATHQCAAQGTCNVGGAACIPPEADQCLSEKCNTSAGKCSDNSTSCTKDLDCQACSFTQFKPCDRTPATMALFPDDPSNVYHSYISDHTTFRILHGGSDLHHVHHQHAHQWMHSPDTSDSDYLDSQSIGPGSAFNLEMVFNGSGNVNQTVGDSIFHCHFYPHFAGGMWSLWRVHDVYETGTLLQPNGAPVNSPTQPNRALPDGEIAAGTPIPALVPLPTIPMPPMPAFVHLTSDDPSAGGSVVADVCDNTSTSKQCNHPVSVLSSTGDPNAYKNPGFPFFIPGVGGQRAPHPPLDFAYSCSDDPGRTCTPEIRTAFTTTPADVSGCKDPKTATCDGKTAALDGGLPRHLILACQSKDPKDCSEIPPLTDFDDFSKTLTKVSGLKLPEDGTFVEQVAMGFHSQRLVPSRTPENNPFTINGYSPFLKKGDKFILNWRPAKFILNGLKPVAGAPLADPCIRYGLNGGKPYWDFTRRYEAADIQLDVTFNKEGWHYPQQRMLSLWGDVHDYLSGTRPPEPFFFRANSGNCIQYVLANLVPNVYELDDFQVRTPTDILGQHIHLVKFDVTSSDGATNGFNYEDGTFAPNEVTERIKAINAGGGLEGNVPKTLTAKELPFFGPGPGGQWVGAQATIQRWYTDRLFNGQYQDINGVYVGRGVDRTLRTVFTHDHFGPSTHQQAGLYAGLVIEPEQSAWYHNDAGPGDKPFGGCEKAGLLCKPVPPRSAPGYSGRSTEDGGPTTWQAVIVPQSKPDSSFREFLLEFQDSTLTYQPFDTITTPPSLSKGFCEEDPKVSCTPSTAQNFNQPNTKDCKLGRCIGYGFCSTTSTGSFDPTSSTNPAVACKPGTDPDELAKICPAATGATPSCNFIAGIPSSAVAAGVATWNTTPLDNSNGVELITLSNATNSFSVNYRSEPLFPRINSGSSASNASDVAFAYNSIDRGSLRGICSQSQQNTCLSNAQCDNTCSATTDGTCAITGASCSSTEPCASLGTCTLGGFCSDNNAFCTAKDLSRCATSAATCGSFPYPSKPLTAGVGAGDPFTPLLRAYAGDDVQIRTLVGAHINPHNFTMHDVKWLEEPSFVDSGWRNSEVMGISEHFEEITRLPPSVTGAGSSDYLYMIGAAAMEQAGGNWGLMRAYAKPQTGLKPLPQNGSPATVAVCPPDKLKNPKQYSVVAAMAAQAITGGNLVYNTRGPIEDPNAILYFSAPQTCDPTNLASCGLPITCSSSHQCSNDSSTICQTAGDCIQPLVLRANAGDCMQVTLHNALTSSTSLGAGASPRYNQCGQPNPSGSATPCSSNTSANLGLHPQLVTTDVTTSNGFNAGNNADQLAQPGTSQTYTWYAGNIDPRAKGDPFIPIEFGAANLLPSDVINHFQYGLFGALVIEPKDASCWVGEKAQPVESCTRTTAQIVNLKDSSKSFREFVLITQDGLQGPPSPGNGSSTPFTMQTAFLAGDNMNAVNYRTEILNNTNNLIRASDVNGDTSDLSNILTPDAYCCSGVDGKGNCSFTKCDDAQTPTFTACAGEPVRFRILHPGGINTNHVFELHGHVWQEQPYMSSGKGCPVGLDSPTTQTNLYSSSQIGNGNLCDTGKGLTSSYPLEQDVFSEYQGSRIGHGPSNHFDVLVQAGGTDKVPGDYLYRSYPADHFKLGLWGIFRVESCKNGQPIQGAAAAGGGAGR